jgi:hypothetical protein
MKTRVCSKCGMEHPLDKEHFGVNPRYTEGFTRMCNWCRYTPEYGRMKQMERRYGITVEQYEEKLESQGGHCALCSTVQGDTKRRLTVDHDHSCCDKEQACGKCNRGILCANCNRELGSLERLMRDFINYENAEVYLRNSVVPQSWTHKALQYLKGYRTQK